MVERQLAESVREQGWAPLQPSVCDPPFDLAWFTSDIDISVVEVKSINKRNEAKQLRLGIGQILDYAETMRRRGLSVTPMLHLSHPPTDERWTTICERAQITLTWAPRSR